jgi:hypothetical protein
MKTRRTHLFAWQDRFVDAALPILGQVILGFGAALAFVLLAFFGGVIAYGIASIL